MSVAIYCRVSTEDQDANNQVKDCTRFAEQRGLTVYGVYIENISGYKDIKREKYEEVKELARNGTIKGVIVWALDRWVRNRETLLEDTVILRNYGCKIYSVKESYLEAINIEGALGKTIQEFLMGLIGSIAEMESQRKSERIKLAVRKVGNITKSYKGNKWGRKSLPKQTKTKILTLYEQGYTIRKIAELVKTYDKHGNAKSISKSFVHKVIQEIK